MDANNKGGKVLRTRRLKAADFNPLTNAEKCKQYKDRLKQDPAAWELYKKKRKEVCRKYAASLSKEQKVLRREKDRIRQQRYRERHKASGKKMKKPSTAAKKTPSKSLQWTPQMIRKHYQKIAVKREQNRLRQQRRRANMSPQKKRREKERRRQYYVRSKQSRNQKA